MIYGYDWMLHEPGAWEKEYGGVEHSVDFVLAPVTSWEDRLRMEMSYDMAGEMTWAEFVQKPSLIAQLSLLATRGPKPDEYGKRDRYEGEYPYLLLTEHLVGRALDWIRETFRARLGNRAHWAASEEGSWGLDRLCNQVTERFNYGARYAELPRIDLDAGFQASMERIAEAGRHELYFVLQAGGWNGWEEKAWLRFIGDVDKARRDSAETARAADHERRRIDTELNNHRRTQVSSEAERGCIPEPPSGSYIAADYADSMRKAYSADPQRIRLRGPYGFKALRDAAGLSVTQERTVKRWLKYEGAADGFGGFVKRLFAVVGELPPE